MKWVAGIKRVLFCWIMLDISNMKGAILLDHAFERCSGAGTRDRKPRSVSATASRKARSK